MTALLAVAMLSGLGAGGAAHAQSGVPPAYQQLYSDTQAGLDALTSHLGTLPAPAAGTMTFGAELGVADGNRGADLLQPQALAGVALALDRLQELGVQGVTITVPYPLYTPADPNYDGYRRFYQGVAALVRQRGMTLDVEAGVVFANTPFSAAGVSYAGLTLPAYARADHAMVQKIIDDLSPDYLSISSEPSTSATLLGLSQINDPAVNAAFVGSVLDGVQRGTTLLGAGAGTWESPEFVQRLAATSLDYIDLHVYPLTAQTVANLGKMAAIARQAGLPLVLDEAWLYKATAQELGNGTPVAATPAIFKRDPYSFWAPLDQEFLYDLSTLAQNLGVRYFSPFWSGYFFAYLDDDPADEALSYAEQTALFDQAEVQALLNDTFSDTGLYYAGLIAAANGAQ